jgi:hypothetical protein
MPFEVWNPRFAGFLSRIFQGRGGRGGAPLTVLDDVLPTINIIDPGEFENHYGRGEIPFAWSGYAGPVALQWSYGVVSNPAGSGCIVVIERCTVSGASAAGNIAGGWSSVYVAPASAATSNDGRAILGSPPGVAVGTGSAAINLVNGQLLVYAPITSVVEELIPGPPLGWVIIPGQTFMVQGQGAANTGFDVSISGYSRVAEPGELSA